MSLAPFADLLALLLAGIILVRCVCILNLMQCNGRSHYLFFAAFGIAYIALAVSALGAALGIIGGRGGWTDWGFLVSSVALIAFDRRRPECFDQRRPCDTPPAGGHA